MLNNIATIINCLSLVIVSIVAIIGINSWKKEARWKKRNDLAEELLSLFLGSRDGISSIRSPFAWNEEGKTRKPSPNEPPDLKDSLDRAYIVNERYDSYKDEFNKLFTLRYRALIYFGKEVEEAILEIYKIIRKIFSSAEMLGRFYWPKLGRTMDEKRLSELIKNISEHEKVFWFMGDDDEISKEVQRAVEKADKELKKWIR